MVINYKYRRDLLIMLTELEKVPNFPILRQGRRQTGLRLFPIKPIGRVSSNNIQFVIRFVPPQLPLVLSGYRMGVSRLNYI